MSLVRWVNKARVWQFLLLFYSRANLDEVRIGRNWNDKSNPAWHRVIVFVHLVRDVGARMYHDRWRSSQPDKIHPGQLSSLILSERIPNSKRATCWNALPWVISEMVPPYKVLPIPIQSNSNAPNVHCVCDAKFSHEFNFAKLQPEWVSESMSWCDATLSGEGITGDCSQGRVRECSLTLPCSSSWHRQTRGLEHDLETEGGVGCNDQHFDHLKNICWYYFYSFYWVVRQRWFLL